MAAAPHPSDLPEKRSLRRYSRAHKTAFSASFYAAAENSKMKPEDLMYQWTLILPFTEGTEEDISTSIKTAEGPCTVVCRHCLPRWLTNSSNGSVFEHNAAGVNIQILPWMGKVFSRCLKMGWLIIKTGVVQARGTSEMRQQGKKKKAALFAKGDRFDNILFLLEDRYFICVDIREYGHVRLCRLFYWYQIQVKNCGFFTVVFKQSHIARHCLWIKRNIA